jgi:hypothetical protein
MKTLRILLVDDHEVTRQLGGFHPDGRRLHLRSKPNGGSTLWRSRRDDPQTVFFRRTVGWSRSAQDLLRKDR